MGCFIFIICIDSLRSALQQAAGVQTTSGFVDDWAAAIGVANFDIAASRFLAVLVVVEEFERASGSTINRRKSKLYNLFGSLQYRSWTVGSVGMTWGSLTKRSSWDSTWALMPL